MLRSRYSFFSAPAKPLEREKRRNEVVDVTASAKELVGYLKPFFGDTKIDLKFMPRQFAGDGVGLPRAD